MNLRSLNIIRKITVSFFAIGVLLSLNLWHSNRYFPTIPVFDFIPDVSIYINYTLLILLFVYFGLVFISSNKKYIVVTLSIIFVLLLQDQMRWQPWVYIYSLFLIPFLFDNPLKNEIKKINYFQIILIGVYLWSGIHKLNPNFIELIYRSILIDLYQINNESLTTTILQLGYIIPLIEIMMGIALFFPKTRKIGVITVVLSHLFILLYISPLGINYNTVIYPWNIAMILFTVLLFWNTKNKIVVLRESNIQYKIANIAIVLLFWILPSLNFIGKWDSYLSFSLYSGKTSNFYILIKDTEIEKIDTSIYRYYYRNIEGLSEGKIIDIGDWSFRELNVPCYPETRVLKKLSERLQLCNENVNSKNIIFTDFEFPLWSRILNKKSSTNKTELHFLKFEEPLNIPKHTYFYCD
ncbi:MAG: hypothetical protein L3J14_07505 [Flavobacteriaceae bacterium]|nr:hypothetical protein [Flavobacteriaceae bacterium]